MALLPVARRAQAVLLEPSDDELATDDLHVEQHQSGAGSRDGLLSRPPSTVA